MTAVKFSQRRELVFNVFNAAAADLNALNSDIEDAVKANANTVAALQAQNKELQKIKTSNEKTINFFSKIFKA